MKKGMRCALSLGEKNGTYGPRRVSIRGSVDRILNLTRLAYAGD